VDPACRAPGREYERFRFSQCVEDIRTTLDHLEQAFDSRRAVLVSFSQSAIEARRVTATDDRVHGWVSVVGAPDLQNSLRILSGGIDFPYGHQRGVRFGIQEMLGVPVDMDLAIEDGLAHNLWFAEDGRRDMMNVRVPVVWIHGRYDAWMDLDRVQDILSCGDTSRRRLIEIPIGHQMRTSTVALESFQLIASETLRMLTGREAGPTLPDLAALDERRRAERVRVRAGAPDLHAFWEDYLLGRDRDFGIDLLASMSSYENLMTTQIERLGLAPSARIADLGAGTGALAAYLGRLADVPPVDITALDFVSQGLGRARERAAPIFDAGGALHAVRCDLSLRHSGAAVPLATGTFDAALASLLVSYLDDPARLLAEAHRILKPGGRLVVSSLRRDADTSKLYVEGIEELRAGRGAERLGPHATESIDRALRSFMNDASRLLELEENETFRFYDAGELTALVEAAGFRDVRVDESFGDPPQAVVVSARR
jgi:SAM-dependent methyltransferase